jgi:hypothetical protein
MTVSYPRQTIAVVLLLAFATLLGAMTPRVGEPIRRLVKHDADSGRPVTTEPVNIEAIIRAAELLPDDASYYLQVPQTTERAQLSHDAVGIAHLYLLPSLNVEDVRNADWVLNYQERPLVPPGVHREQVIPLGDGIFLVRLRAP